MEAAKYVPSLCMPNYSLMVWHIEAPTIMGFRKECTEALLLLHLDWCSEFLQHHDNDDDDAIAPWLMLRVSPTSSSWWQINASGRRNHWRNVSWNTKDRDERAFVAVEPINMRTRWISCVCLCCFFCFWVFWFVPEKSAFDSALSWFGKLRTNPLFFFLCSDSHLFCVGFRCARITCSLVGGW